MSAAANSKLVLYSYWRSSSSWRVRFALEWKGLDYEVKPIHLLKNGGEQLTSEYAELNPMKEVPTLVVDDVVITQSMSIIEYLEEVYPTPSLLPKDAMERAKVRTLVEVISADIQPLQNLRVLKKIGDEKKVEWSQYFIHNGFAALEKLLEDTAGKYCYGDELSFADLCLVPQVYNALRFKIDVTKYPQIHRINENLAKLEAYKKSQPSSQIDCPENS